MTFLGLAQFVGAFAAGYVFGLMTSQYIAQIVWKIENFLND